MMRPQTIKSLERPGMENFHAQAVVGMKVTLINLDERSKLNGMSGLY